MTKKTDTAPLRAELKKAAADKGSQTVYDLLEREAPELRKALPESIGLDAFTGSVLAELRRSPELLDCSPASLVGACLLAARLGLDTGPLGLVYLVPHKGRVDFVIGYRGYVALAYRSGQVKDVAAALVYEGESFEYRQGTRPFLDHVPTPSLEARDIAAAYAVARLRSGGSVFAVIYEAEWERARKASETGSKNEGPWAEHRGSMIRKTAVRRLQPMLPQSALLARAVERDDAPAPELAELTETAVPL
jgi:recombination protein RecT